MFKKQNCILILIVEKVSKKIELKLFEMAAYEDTK